MNQRLDYQKNAGPALRGLAEVHRQLAQSGLPRTLVNLVYLRVSQINGCAYCISVHNSDLLKDAVPLAKLMLLPAWREAVGVYDESERAALQWAESLTLVAQTGAPDADYDAVIAKFDDKDVVDLTVAIGLINAYNRLGIGFRHKPGPLPSETRNCAT